MIKQSRRHFLTTAAAVAAAGLVGTPRALAREGAPETNSVALAKTPALCTAPQFIAEELLRAEGFTDDPLRRDDRRPKCRAL